MFDLYKKRKFGDYISDSITFIRTFAKHYFGNYFAINGVFLMILAVGCYFLMEILMNAIFAMARQGQSQLLWNDYLNGSGGLIITTFIITLLMIILLSLCSFTYTVVYFELVDKHKGNDFTRKEIRAVFKTHIGRMFLFFLLSLITIFPILILFFMAATALSFMVIGIPLLVIFGPSMLAWVSLSYYEYLLNRQIGYFGALSHGLEMVRNSFLAITGATLIITIIIQILQSAVTMIPYVIGIIMFMVSTDSGNVAPNQETFSMISVMMAIIFVISIVAGYFFNNLMIVSQGIIYYTAKENETNNSAHMEIDNIGTFE
ncbi:MAG: hypothetical protein CFE23_10640 [Flavobacterium sp. BFFFF1]|uniref:hypothetical protein n=1 Tax=Flavobacterium sp. BFFFF1 TaxID=2015557 RepID=UPI000BCF1EFB|nr:hypothetical protein [Flavobacterium sp. BFFFF1]OYU80170.1 MAG: hypothetical protein CFE23_10640 [Flavobacterium sp. BFFFF1]